MPNALLGVTGSVAAIYTVELYQALAQAGFRVKVVATKAACYFFDPAAIEPRESKRNPGVVVLDEDEWPGQQQGQHYQRSDPVLHIELRRWADILVIAPLDANTLAKLAYGLADNCLTCVARAWDRKRPVILAPAMNTLMWEHPATLRHLRLLAEDYLTTPPADDPTPDGVRLARLVEWMNQQNGQLHILHPQTKRLACDDVGVGAMASLPDILAAVVIKIKLGRRE